MSEEDEPVPAHEAAAVNFRLREIVQGYVDGDEDAAIDVILTLERSDLERAMARLAWLFVATYRALDAVDEATAVLDRAITNLHAETSKLVFGGCSVANEARPVIVVPS